MSKQTAEELEQMGLTPEEIAAILEDDDTTDEDTSDADDAAAGAAGAGADDAAGGTGGDDEAAAAAAAAAGGAGADNGDGAAAGAAAGGTAPPAAAAAAPPAAAAPAAPPAPNPRIAEIEAGLSTLDQQFDDGELTASEYRQQQKTLAGELDDLRWNERSQQLREDIKFEDRKNRWFSTVQTFLGKADMTAFYKPETPGLAFNALNAAVIQLQNEARAAGLDDTDPSIMERAHKQVQAEFGIGTAAPPPAATEQPAPGTPQPQTRKPAPLTLANVPASAGTETSDQRWAALDRLRDNPNPEDPEAYERAVGALSPEMRAAYLAAG